MKEYMIYTTNDSEPFIVKTDEDLQDKFKTSMANMVKYMEIKHSKDLLGLGKYTYKVLLNVDNIVSISTREKVE